MMNLKEILNEFKEISYYKINSLKKESTEGFFVSKKLETVRKTDTLDEILTIYVLHDGFIGSQSLHVKASLNEFELRGKIKNAILCAKLVSNKVYPLVGDEKGTYDFATNVSNYDPISLLNDIKNSVFNALSTREASLNATEIFINKLTRSVTNSNGLLKTEISYEVMIESIPTYTTKENSVELYYQYHFSSFDAADLTRRISEKIKDVKSRAVATKMDIKEGINVILDSDEINQILSRIKYNLNYENVYANQNYYHIGDLIQNGNDNDKINLELLSFIEGSTRSKAFDDDGLSFKDIKIITDGKISNYYGSLRFASYLGMEPTGNLPCMKLLPGSIDYDTLTKTPYLRCVSFSGLQVDLYQDYIGGEVRLAYYFDGKNTYPVTGISISGKLSNFFNTLRLTNDQVLEGSYLGPSHLISNQFKIN